MRNRRRYFQGKGRRNLLLRSLFLLFALTVGCSAALADNLLINGGFEEIAADGLPAGWTTDAYRLEEGYTVFSASESDPAEGDRTAFIRNIGANDARFLQKVSVAPESLYRFSGYLRTENVEEGRGANLSVEGLYVFSESVSGTSDGWQYVEWYGETGPEQTEVTLFARLGGYSGESLGKAWFDDLRLEQVNEVPGDEIASLWYQQKSLSYYDEEEDAQQTGTASPAWPLLILGSLAWALIAVLVFQALRRRRSGSLDRQEQTAVFYAAGLAAAFLTRLVIAFHVTGYMVDVNCFTAWGNTMASHGPAGFYPETNFCDYPPAYTYILGLNALISRLFSDSPGLVRVVYRFCPSLCDILSCLVLDRFLSRRSPSVSAFSRRIMLVLLAFHPVTVLNAAAWGQMDSALALLLLLVAVWAIDEKWEFCLPSYMLAVLVKPQALLLGFLGLIAILAEWVRKPKSRRKILIGTGFALALMLLVVVPFSLRQEPFWIVNQYAGTLSSYPYATLNTANLYYLFDGNWAKISGEAPPAVGLTLAALCAAYGACFFLRARKSWKHAWIECALSGAFSAFFLFCAFSGAAWSLAGTGSMAFAFVIVLSLYLRRGKIEFLPYLGGLLFLLLYVFGVKMHERYIFPAFLFLSMALGLRRDRRILTVLIVLTCTAFINEGIVLDNSIRLGSAQGHLNPDTHVLALLLSAVNCLNACYAAWLGFDLALREEDEAFRPRPEEVPQDNRLHWKKWDTLLLCLILGVYSAVCFPTLGSTKAPQTAWTSSEFTENVVLDLGEEQDSFLMLYFARVSRYDFSVSVSSDGENWEEETWAQMDQGQCWKWKYVTDSTIAADGSRSYGSARHWFSGRYVRLIAHQINLALCEVIFRDQNGRILPIRSVERHEGDPESVLYSDPEALRDEQDTFEALPVYFATEADQADGEENPRIAQPSWWNSTYFDEIYHARTAWEFLQGSVPYETSHPPLGKILMSWGVAAFGMTPFGWRFAGALAGVAMLAVIYLIGKQMTKRTSLSAFACALLALDCMHFTQTQIATIDSFPVLFILMAFFFMLRFLQTDWRSAPRRRVLTDLGLSGFSMGLAIASKWIGIYAGAGLAVLFFWHGIRTLRAETTRDDIPVRKAGGGTALRKFVRICLWCLVFFVLIPAGIYLLSYLPYFAYRHLTSFRDYLEAVISSQQGMLSYHSTPGLGMDHPFYSPWYEWPVIGKPMFYSTKQYIFNDALSFSIFCIGNPVIWWSALPAMICCIWLWIRNREAHLPHSMTADCGFASLDTNLVFLLVGFLAQYLPWTLVPRGTYIYHYFASVPFLILSLTLCLGQVRLRYPRTARAAGIVFLLLALGAMILFFPYVSGILSPVRWLDAGREYLRVWY